MTLSVIVDTGIVKHALYKNVHEQQGKESCLLLQRSHQRVSKSLCFQAPKLEPLISGNIMRCSNPRALRENGGNLLV